MVQTNEAIDIAQRLNEADSIKAIAHVDGRCPEVKIRTDKTLVVPFQVVEAAADYETASLIKDGEWNYEIS